jgi:DNA (cytosine-5)-methyltransferase 1
LPIRRHRLFESNVTMWTTPCSHEEYPAIYQPAWNRTNLLRVMVISGGYYQRQGSLEDHKTAMGVTWDITVAELSEAIPPAYTEFIGEKLISAISQVKKGGE